MADVKVLSTLTRFAADKMQKVSVFDTAHLFCDLYCLEPGQAQKAHSHGDADKVYLVLEGTAQIQIGAERVEAGPHQAVLAPSGTDHGVTNPGPGRVVLYVLMAPNPGGAAGQPGRDRGHRHEHGHDHRH